MKTQLQTTKPTASPSCRYPWCDGEFHQSSAPNEPVVHSKVEFFDNTTTALSIEVGNDGAGPSVLLSSGNIPEAGFEPPSRVMHDPASVRARAAELRRIADALDRDADDLAAVLGVLQEPTC